MAWWVNRLRNNIFVNPPPLPLSCETSGALHLALATLDDLVLHTKHEAGYIYVCLISMDPRYYV